jgi:hypothetical protein
MAGSIKTATDLLDQAEQVRLEFIRTGLKMCRTFAIVASTECQIGDRPRRPTNARPSQAESSPGDLGGADKQALTCTVVWACYRTGRERAIQSAGPSGSSEIATDMSD